MTILAKLFGQGPVTVADAQKVRAGITIDSDAGRAAEMVGASEVARRVVRHAQ